MIMESLVNFIFAHAVYAPWLIFGSLILAGFHLPISEDLVIIVSGILASSIIPEYALILYLMTFLGCYFSDSIAYWTGRIGRDQLGKFKWFQRTIFSPKVLARVDALYKKYGFFALIFGRFIPFGVRGCLFATIGMGKIHYARFLLKDALACLISSSSLFLVTYALGKNYKFLLNHIKTINIAFFIVFAVTIIGIVCYYLVKRKKRAVSINSSSEK